MAAQGSNKRYKYNDGDVINGFKLIHRGPMSKTKKSCISTFECPFCHREFQADLYNISRTKYNYKSCGCKKINLETGLLANIKDLTGKRFGMLTVDKISDKRVPHPSGGYYIYWDCTCDCGNKKTVAGNQLVSEHVFTCGKHNLSKGEIKIKNILDNLNIEYIHQYTIDDCRNPKTNHLLFFDFYLPLYEIIIEFDGEQHFHIPTNKKSTFFTQEEIDNVQYRDMIKTKYCEQNDYDLIRIPYMNYDILDENYFMNKLIIHKERGTWTR